MSPECKFLAPEGEVGCGPSILTTLFLIASALRDDGLGEVVDGKADEVLQWSERLANAACRLFDNPQRKRNCPFFQEQEENGPI